MRIEKEEEKRRRCLLVGRLTRYLMRLSEIRISHRERERELENEKGGKAMNAGIEAAVMMNGGGGVDKMVLLLRKNKRYCLCTI